MLILLKVVSNIPSDPIFVKICWKVAVKRNRVVETNLSEIGFRSFLYRNNEYFSTESKGKLN